MENSEQAAYRIASGFRDRLSAGEFRRLVREVACDHGAAVSGERWRCVNELRHHAARTGGMVGQALQAVADRLSVGEVIEPRESPNRAADNG